MAKSLHFNGAFTAIVTPFKKAELDLEALDALVEYQISGGITGLVPCGTTGESPSLSGAEQQTVIARTLERAQGRCFVVAGTGSNNTREAIERTKAAEAVGVDAAMIVMPYYNRPTQKGLIAHVRAIHDATELPLVLYNVPPRTAVDLSTDSIVELARCCPRFVALKEATGNVLRTQQVVAALGSRLSVLSGDDVLTLGILACGGTGVISVTSNVAPKAVESVVQEFHKGAFDRARAQHLALLNLHDAMFLETNPGPAKAALALLGVLGPELRLPLVSCSESTVEKLRTVLAQYELLTPRPVGHS